MINQELLKVLACPACDQRPPLTLDEANSKLVCTVCKRKYPVREGIPVMLVEEAEK